jgi:hypothetical protein
MRLGRWRWLPVRARRRMTRGSIGVLARGWIIVLLALAQRRGGRGRCVCAFITPVSCFCPSNLCSSNGAQRQIALSAWLLFVSPRPLFFSVSALPCSALRAAPSIRLAFQQHLTPSVFPLLSLATTAATLRHHAVAAARERIAAQAAASAAHAVELQQQWR